MWMADLAEQGKFDFSRRVEELEDKQEQIMQRMSISNPRKDIKIFVSNVYCQLRSLRHSCGILISVYPMGNGYTLIPHGYYPCGIIPYLGNYHTIIMFF